MSDPYASARRQMVEQQLQARDIHDPRVLQAFTEIPRHRFVPPYLQSNAYEDRPLPIGQDQTISQPYIVAKMLSWLELAGEEHILEIGTGSGYQTALLAHLVKHVVSLERMADLASGANKTLQDLGIENVEIHQADGSLGWPPAAPYDAIIVSAAAPKAPPALLEQLAEGSYLVLPVGQPGSQRLQRWQRRDNLYRHENGPSVAFVPLIGQAAWKP